MSNPDFFLPFHLPMVLPDNDILNITCDLTKDSIETKEGVYACRFRFGAYQTAKTRLGYMAFNPTIKLFPFSISLN